MAASGGRWDGYQAVKLALGERPYVADLSRPECSTRGALSPMPGPGRSD
jgi:hypothetical protein